MPKIKKKPRPKPAVKPAPKPQVKKEAKPAPNGAWNKQIGLPMEPTHIRMPVGTATEVVENIFVDRESGEYLIQLSGGKSFRSQKLVFIPSYRLEFSGMGYDDDRTAAARRALDKAEQDWLELQRSKRAAK